MNLTVNAHLSLGIHFITNYMLKIVLMIMLLTFRPSQLEDEIEQDFKTIASILPNIEIPDIPLGSVIVLSSLKKHPGNVYVYTRTWKLPNTIKITGTEHLFGATMLSKMEILFTACEITSNFITMMELNHPNYVVVHFKNKYIRLYVKNVLTNYCARNFEKLVNIL